MAGAAELFRAVGLLPDGPVVLGRPMRANVPGVYAIELPGPLPEAPIELTRVGKWIERVPTLRLDGERPTSKALAARLAAFWLPSTAVVFIGSSEASVAGRVAALERHVLGDRRPYAAAQWLKALTITGARVWWAATDAPEEYEDALLAAFAERVPGADRAGLHDGSLVLPFANLRMPSGARKAHGITGAVPPAEPAVPAVPTHVVEVAPGDADGARATEPGKGSVRRPARAPGTSPTRRQAPARPPAPVAPAPQRPGAEPVYLSPEGLARMEAELDELRRVRRPEVIARIRSAKELGDLKENADYTAAREEQSFLEGRVQALEARLREAVVVEAPGSSSRVVMGSKVTAIHDDEAVTLTIVGSSESDPAAGRISYASPVGRALLGRAVDDDVVISVPNGEIRYRITAIE
jgi:transcription elongation factor GreA